MENTMREESLENSVEIEVKVDNVILNDENVTLKVNSRSKLFALLETNISFVYNKIMKLVSCTTNSIDTILYEPSTHEPRTHIELLTDMKEPVKEYESLVVIEQQVVVEEPVVSLVPVDTVEAVVVQEPVSIEERM
jgi:hypothetical protein